jgi:hypothetical protein
MSGIQPALRLRYSASSRDETAISRAGFRDQLGWHFDPKIARMSMASAAISDDYNHLHGRYAWRR